MTFLLYKIRKSKNEIIDRFENRFIDKVSVPDYNIQEIENFITPEQCDHIIELSRPTLVPSLVYSDKSDVYNTNSRLSEQTWLKNNVDPIVEYISRKVADISGLPIENQEDLQVVSYKPGGFFTPHYDSCEGNSDYCNRMDGDSGPRYFTYIIYLNDDLEGGETAFPKLNIQVKPKKGKCVIFQSTLPPPDGRTILEALHGGNPVTAGNKWICNKWIRTNVYKPQTS